MQQEQGIIRSVLDTDLYKLTQQQAVCKLFPRVKVKYKFFNRGGTKFPEGFGAELRKEIAKMATLRLTLEEKKFLSARCGRFMDEVYIDFLAGYQFEPSEVGIVQNGGDLDVDFDGYWYRAILWEVPVMALISELYFKMTGEKIKDKNDRQKNNVEKGKAFYGHNLKLTDFGTRRRYSYDNQLEVCSDLSGMFGNERCFIGTSNVHIAMRLKINPIGTHAHEWFMFMAAKYGYKMANEKGLEHWVEVYKGDLGIALPDTFTSDVFFKSFDRKYSKLFDGVRHDSGEPTEFADKVTAHYKSQNIKPSSKTITFSNNLNTIEALRIGEYCHKNCDGIDFSFGIGTFLSNDVGVKPLNMVIKMTAAFINDEWIPTIKLSDDKGKNTGDSEEIELAERILHIKHESKTTVNISLAPLT